MKGSHKKVSSKLFDSIVEIGTWPMFRHHKFSFVREEFKSVVRLSVHVDGSFMPIFEFSSHGPDKWTKPALKVTQQSFGAEKFAQFLAQANIMQTGLLDAERAWMKEQS